jgi:1-acyl-sn-glycerol-3-phosphate acyltransferase
MPGERNPWWVAGRVTVGSAFRAGFRVRFGGLEHIPRRGGALLAYNHVSVLDPIPVALAAARVGREMRFLALSELFEQGWVGWGLRVTEQIPLRRGLGDWDAIEAVASVLRDGRLAGMSPEGTVGPGDELLPGKRGAARIALAAGVPIVPVAVWGTQDRWPQAGLHRKPPLRPAVAVVAGAAIPPEGSARSRPDTIAHTDRLMKELAAAVDRARGLARTRPAQAAEG